MGLGYLVFTLIHTNESCNFLTIFFFLLHFRIHYLTRQSKGELRSGVIVLIDAILEAMCKATEDRVLRQTASAMLYEYLKWSNKQQTDPDQARNNKSAKLLITRLYSMWVHPQDKRRLAASAAFNSIYTIFRENESLVDVYTMEIFVHVMQSLQLSQNVDCEGTFLINDTLEQDVKILRQEMRIISQKFQVNILARSKIMVKLSRLGGEIRKLRPILR